MGTLPLNSRIRFQLPSATLRDRDIRKLEPLAIDSILHSRRIYINDHLRNQFETKSDLHLTHIVSKCLSAKNTAFEKLHQY